MKSFEFINFLYQEDIYLFLEETPVDKTLEKVKDKKIEEKEEIIFAKDSFNLTEINDLNSLKNALETINHPLKITALNMVFSKGNCNNPKIMFIGDFPEKEDNINGIPFSGKAGNLLNNMILALKLSPNDYYITNIINYFSKDNNIEYIKDFTPFIKKHIELIQPEKICILGSTAFKALFNDRKASRGEWIEFNNIPTLPTFSPNYLLKFPMKKVDAWKDIQKLTANINI